MGVAMAVEPIDLIASLVDGFLSDASAGEKAVSVATARLPADVLADLDAVLADSRVSYRDGVIIQFAYGVATPGCDLTKRQVGARTVAQQLGAFLAERHIKSVKDAYQNIGKNSDNLIRGNVVSFDRLLTWGKDVDADVCAVVLEYVCARVAATARPVLPMPAINRSALTFSRTTKLLLDLVATPSGGAFDQFTVAALLHATVANHGPGATRVDTKNLNASDRSSFAAGDVQIATGGRVIEAFEVTANHWTTKVGAAAKTIRDNDLSRLHIVAARPEGERAEAAKRLDELDVDVAVLDVRQTVEVLTAVLTRPQRAEALSRLYEFLDRYQPDIDRTNHYVKMLIAADLVERSSD